MNHMSGRVLLLTAALALLLVPAVALGAGDFVDVPDGHTFKADIEWLASVGVTKGCNPPTNDRFCPENPVTRGQMAAFIHRLADGVVHAKSALSAATADNADKVDGKHASAFLAANAKAADADKLDGKNSTAFMTKTAYDSDTDGVVDSAEVKIRHAFSGFNVDMSTNEFDRMKCVTDHVAFSSPTTVVASGGLSLEPNVASNLAIYGYVYYRSARAGGVWTKLSGLGVEDTPSHGGLGAAAVPIDAVGTINAGTYTFGISPFGYDIQPGPSYDYSGFCELTVTAYTGQGASTDLAINSAGLTAEEAHADS